MECIRSGKGIGCIKHVVAEKAVGSSVEIVAARLAHNVDRSAAGRAQLRRVVRPIDLELLYCVLAQIHEDGAGVTVDLADVDGHTVAAAIAAVEGQPGLGRLPYAEISAVHLFRAGYARREQGEGQVVATINGQVVDVLLLNYIALRSALRVDHRWGCGHHRLRGGSGNFEAEIDDRSLTNVYDD